MMQPYPAYKDSGINWVGKIPDHWQVLKGKWLFKKMQRPVRDEDDVVTVFRDGMVTLRSNRRTEGFTNSLKEIGYQGIRKGDLVIHQMDAFAGAIGVSDSDGKSTPVYSVCLPLDDVDPNYYAYLLRRMAQSQWILALAKGIRERSSDFRFNEFANQEYPVPPADEQKAIVAFLEEQTAVINQFLTNKRRLIALLEEQKQVVINTAVTQGLDTAVPRKPSGIDWLEKIPAHWTEIKLSMVAKVYNGTTPSRNRPDYWDGNIPWLSSGKVNDFVVKAPSEYVTDKALAESSISLVPKGAVIIGMIGQGKTRGLSALLEIEACINQNLAAIVPNHRLDGKYLHYFLLASYEFIREYGRGGNQEALNCQIISAFRVPLPPISEQHKIVWHIEQKTAEINAAIERTQREIELIEEYRTTLIAHAVTGKIDVRFQ